MTGTGVHSELGMSQPQRVMISDPRHLGQTDQPPADLLQHLPALVVLERITVPLLVVGGHCSILFRNAAFADLLGHTKDTLEQLTLHQIILSPVDWLATSPTGTWGAELVKLRHRDGFTVAARTGKSLIRRENDEVLLVVFEDLTEQLWQQP